jgi:hypothetical protein
MERVREERTAQQFRAPGSLRTSELMREAAGWLTTLARSTPAELEALAFELRVRARWIEGARADEGVSGERRMAIAAIEDVDAANQVIPAVRR